MRLIAVVIVLGLLCAAPASAGLFDNSSVGLSIRQMDGETEDATTVGADVAKYLRVSPNWLVQLGYATSGQDYEGMFELAAHRSLYHNPDGSFQLTLGAGGAFRGFTEPLSEFGGIAALGCNIHEDWHAEINGFWGLNEKRSYWPAWGITFARLFDWEEAVPF